MEPNQKTPIRFLWLSYILLLVALLLPGLASAQISFPKSGYYLAIGDSISAGEGAMPVTQGAVYRLYDQGVFGAKQVMDFSNIAIRAARTYEVLNFQVPEAVCLTGFEPTVVTITVGANDFLREFNPPDIPNVEAIAARSADIVDRLLNGIKDSNGTEVCHGLPNVTVLIANNYTVPLPIPFLNDIFDMAARDYARELDRLLRNMAVPPGSRVGIVDLYGAFKDRNGLLLVQKKNGFGPSDFDVHPTNAGHAVIAREFQRTWAALQQ